MFRLEFSTDNAAFSDDEGENGREFETQDILIRIARLIRQGRREGPVIESNGNTIGHWSLSEAEP